MTINPYRFIGLLAASFLLVVGLAVARGEQPECTGDRHYDGVACCPTPSECPEPPTATPCPDPAPCPDVRCVCDAAAPTVVSVDRCPEAPNYVRCRYLKDGTMRCPIKDHPRRVFVPEADAKKSAK